MDYDLNKFAKDGNHFLNALSKELGHEGKTKLTTRKLRAVLHAFRDRITPEESLQLVAQLPMFLKAMYVEGWKPGKKRKRIKHMDDFVIEVRRHDGIMHNYDFKNDDDIENAIKTIFRVLRQYISLGEMEDLKSVLPKDLKFLVESTVMI